MTTKSCTKCLIIKDIDSYYKDNRVKGYMTICKLCSLEKSRKYHRDNRQKLNEKGRLYVERNRNTIYKRNAKYYEKNKLIISKNKIVYNKNNRKRAKELRESKKEELYIKRKIYNENNKEKIYNSQKDYRNNNNGKIRAYSAKRRSSELNSTPYWSELDMIEIIYEKCKWLEGLTGLKYHVDHIIPLQGKNVCGLHCWANLQILEASINLSKGNRI